MSDPVTSSEGQTDRQRTLSEIRQRDIPAAHLSGRVTLPTRQIPWGEFPAGGVGDVTPADMRAAARYFAVAIATDGPFQAVAALLAADRATVQARGKRQIKELFGG